MCIFTLQVDLHIPAWQLHAQLDSWLYVNNLLSYYLACAQQLGNCRQVLYELDSLLKNSSSSGTFPVSLCSPWNQEACQLSKRGLNFDSQIKPCLTSNRICLVMNPRTRVALLCAWEHFLEHVAWFSWMQGTKKTVHEILGLAWLCKFVLQWKHP